MIAVYIYEPRWRSPLFERLIDCRENNGVVFREMQNHLAAGQAGDDFRPAIDSLREQRKWANARQEGEYWQNGKDEAS